MTRSAFFVHASSDLYGSDLACLHVARRAVERGWAVEVTLPRPGALADELTALGVAVHWLDPLKPRRADLRLQRLPQTVRHWLRSWRAVRRLAAARRFDVVYTTTAPTLAGTFLARRWRARHVYHVHELFWFPTPLVRTFERVLRRADVVVCCSGAVLDQFHDHRIRSRAIIAHTGIDHSGLPAAGPVLAADHAEIVCVARINEWKGQEVLVEAVARLRQAGHDVRLTLVGDVYGGEERFRDRLAERIDALGLTGWVTLAGERRDAIDIVARSDVFVLPSRRPEPFGMALVEAMAVGRPAIGTDAGGPREVVRSGVDGVLVPPGDAAALAGAIAALIDDPDHARALGRRAARRAGAFDIGTMADAVLDAFDAHQSDPAS